MAPVSENLEKFFQEVFPAIVGTKRQDGTVQMNPIWFEYREGYFWLNSWRGSHWLKHVERDGEITLALLDPNNAGRFAQILGRLVEATTEGADDHINHLAMRYTGKPYQAFRPGVQRVKVQIEPTRIVSMLDRAWPSRSE